MMASSPYGGLSSFSVLGSVALASLLVSLWHHRNVVKEKDDLQKELDDLRVRRRTEKRNRKSEKASDNSDGKGTKKTPSVDEDDGLLMKRVGTIRSIYRLCVGTPRQGLLAPNARGCIEMAKLGDSSTVDSVSGLEGYSHIWILFVFHLNTQSSNSKRIKSKIAPPALGGGKVGIYATRTPHRYNPVGITLCKLDSIRVSNKQVRLEVSGLDLVDGTPVLDIKPYVPDYDSVEGDVRVPHWVAGGLATKRRVEITNHARSQLLEIVTKNPRALEFYGPKFGEQTAEDTVDYACGCIDQVLAIDVRSSYQTKKSREGKFQAERSERLRDAVAGETVHLDEDVCTQQLDNLLIQYKVQEASVRKRATSENSGAEDLVEVISIGLMPNAKS
jgi:tRNA-Thr(GGU) m(6)t(6)A37 methyltransferase TsaA